MRNSTVVTALYDIGREHFSAYPRSIDTYLSYMDNILSLNSNIVIFCDNTIAEKIIHIRQKYDNNFLQTKIIITSFEELECYKKFYERTKHVMQTESFLKQNEGSIESLYPKYNIINFNKISFVVDTVNLNPFKSDYFFWIDAGFGHNNFPKQYKQTQYPNCLKTGILDDNKIHFLSLCDEQYISLESMFSSRVSITGSMFAGKEQPLKKFKELIFNTIEDFLSNNAINDDQAIYAYAYMKDKSLFNISVGNWFSNFFLFV